MAHFQFAKKAKINIPPVLTDLLVGKLQIFVLDKAE